MLTSLPSTSQLVMGPQYQPCLASFLSSSVRLVTTKGLLLCTESYTLATLGAELGSKFKWQHMLSARWASGQVSLAKFLWLRSVCRGGSSGVCVCVCVCVFLWARWGGGVGGGSSGPTWARPQALQQDPPGAHQQTAHQLLGEELGGHGEVPVGRMLVVLMVVVGEGAPRRLGEEPSKGTVYRM